MSALRIFFLLLPFWQAMMCLPSRFLIQNYPDHLIFSLFPLNEEGFTFLSFPLDSFSAPDGTENPQKLRCTISPLSVEDGAEVVFPSSPVARTQFFPIRAAWIPIFLFLHAQAPLRRRLAFSVLFPVSGEIVDVSLLFLFSISREAHLEPDHRCLFSLSSSVHEASSFHEEVAWSFTLHPLCNLCDLVSGTNGH